MGRGNVGIGVLLLLVHSAGCTPETVPEESVEVDQVREVWRVGGSEDDEVVLISPVDGAFGPRGMVAVADERLPGIVVLNREGQLVRSLDQRGEGPGEFRQLRAVGFADEELWAWDPTLRRITWFELDGQGSRTRPLSQGEVGGYSALGGHVLENGWILEESIAPSHFTSSDLPPLPVLLRDGQDSLRIVASSPQPGPVYAEQPMRNGFSSTGPQFVGTDPIVRMVGGGGSFFVLERPIPDGPDGTFTVTAFSPAGDTVSTWRREVDAQGTAAEIGDTITARVDAWLTDANSFVREQLERESTIEAYWVPRALPPVSHAVADRRGYWIGREIFREPRTWERYSLEGRLEGRIELPASEHVLASNGRELLTWVEGPLGAPVVRLLVVDSLDIE